MSFDDFARDDPNQIVMGLFNGTLQAAYLFRQISPTEYEGHFTSSRKAERKDVLAGARTLVEWFCANGLEIVAHVIESNRPLCRFLLEAGLANKKVLHSDTANDTVSGDHKTFVEYRSGRMVASIGPKRVETKISGYDG